MQTIAGAGYDVDFVLWAESQAAALREGRFSDVDIENVSEEIEALARRDRSKMRSRLAKLVQHLLELEYQPQKATRSWRLTIFEEATQYWELMNDSPSLKATLDETWAVAYAKGRKLAAIETGLPLATFLEHPTAEFNDALLKALGEANSLNASEPIAGHVSSTRGGSTSAIPLPAPY